MRVWKAQGSVECAVVPPHGSLIPTWIEKIIHLRQHYHFGPMKIRMYLKRYHGVEISASGLWRILKGSG